jgi:flagellar basal-body rod protein FlgB
MTSSGSILSIVESYLKLATSREQVISANMANIDTPGYHTRDIDFQHELSRALSAPLLTTGDSSGTAQFLPVTRQVSGLMERPDGNNVNLDREGLLLAETQLQYELGIQLIKNKLHQQLNAINGGS